MAADRKTQARPQYPAFIPLMVNDGIAWFRGPLLAALFTAYVLRPLLYVPYLKWFATVDLSWLPPQLVEYAEQYEHTSVRDVAFVVFSFMVIHETLYFGLNGLFRLCDTFGLLSQYRLVRTKRMLPSKSLVITCLVEGTVNHFLAQPTTLYLAMLHVCTYTRLFPKGNLTGVNPDEVVNPYENMSFLETYGHFFAAAAINNFFFYWAHRIVHIPSLYTAIHKKHHKFVGTIGWAAEFASPIEQIVANQLPSVGYTLLYNPGGCGHEIAFLWLAWRLIETYEAHSGYDFEATPLGRIGLLHGQHARFHDWHHTDNRGCFGTILLDWAFGTMDSYVEMVMTDPKTKEISFHRNFYKEAQEAAAEKKTQ